MNIDELVEHLHEVLWQTLKELIGKEWIIKPIRNKWDLKFECRLGEFRYSTEWLDLGNLTATTGVQIIAKEAQLIQLRYQRTR